MAEQQRQPDKPKSTRLVIPCSGAPDVGEITDRAARQLENGGAGKLVCLAAVIARLGWVRDTLRAASRVLAIDGCPEDCARKALQEAGVKNLHHIRVTDMDMKEGSSPATPVRIQRVVDEALRELTSDGD